MGSVIPPPSARPQRGLASISLRLRLTLLYSLILALTLIAFSLILYIAQAQVTYSSLQLNLMEQASVFANPGLPFPNGPDGPPAGVFLPGRYTQMLDLTGKVILHTGDLTDSTLPLSNAGLVAVKSGAQWFETAQVQDQLLLILSHPVMNEGQLKGIVQVAASTAERDQALSALRWLLFIGSLVAVGVAFVIGWVIASTALNPIHEIMGIAQAIGAERDYSRRIAHVGPNDEIGQLATTFNTMLNELEGGYQQMEHLSVRDGLTELFNRRYLEETLPRELTRAARDHCPVGVIMVDIDYFKGYNDELGHAAGDALLRQVGAALRAHSRGSDFVCRYGGDELTVILPTASREATRERAEAVHCDVKNMLLNYRHRALKPVTISLGVAVFPEDGLTSDEVLKSADDALYAAKRLGRDRLIVAN